MARVPVIANTESNAGRRIESVQTAKKVGEANPGKDDSTEGSFSNVLRRVRDSGRSDSSETLILRKVASLRHGIRGVKKNGENEPETDGENRIVDDNPLKGKSENRDFPEAERAVPHLIGESVEKGRRSEVDHPVHEKNALNAVADETAIRSGKEADSAVAARFSAETETDEKSQSGKLRRASHRKSAFTGSIEGREQTVRSVVSRASRVVVEDRRVAGEAPKGRIGRTRIRSERQTVSNEPVVNSESEGNRFVVAETDITIESKDGGRSNSGHTTAELARKLDSQAGNEIVRQVKFVLNRADAGEVRINLRPENLGRVRVRIQMEENRLTGRIYVESAAAREAFRSTLDGLQAKLVESGFGAADLELTWDEGGQNLSQFRDSSGRQMKNFGEASREFEGMSSTMVQEGVIIGDGRVDMVV